MSHYAGMERSLSAVLANLFLHYAFDQWMVRSFPHLPFARYAEDVVVHCRTQAEAEQFKTALQESLWAYQLGLHPEKIQIGSCNVKRQGEHNLAQNFAF